MLGFILGSLPFTDIGAPIFKGRQKISYFRPIADKIKAELSTWKNLNYQLQGGLYLINQRFIACYFIPCQYSLGLFH